MIRKTRLLFLSRISILDLDSLTTTSSTALVVLLRATVTSLRAELAFMLAG
jgi:hypothetical protein